MTYFFIFIFLSWALIWFFLFRNRLTPMEQMRAAESRMKTATDIIEKRDAAKRVLDIIERESLAGVVVEDAQLAAKALLR